MKNLSAPAQAAETFYKSLLENKFDFAWSIFSQASKEKFGNLIYKKYQTDSSAQKPTTLSFSEIMSSTFHQPGYSAFLFWIHFFYCSGANEMARLGHYQTGSISGSSAVVKVTLTYQNGQVVEIGLPMVLENEQWKLAYAENNLPFKEDYPHELIWDWIQSGAYKTESYKWL